jgi:hypothetical protein
MVSNPRQHRGTVGAQGLAPLVQYIRLFPILQLPTPFGGTPPPPPPYTTLIFCQKLPYALTLTAAIHPEWHNLKAAWDETQALLCPVA